MNEMKPVHGYCHYTNKELFIGLSELQKTTRRFRFLKQQTTH